MLNDQRPRELVAVGGKHLEITANLGAEFLSNQPMCFRNK